MVKTIDRSGDLLPRTVVLIDEAGMAPTRQSAVLFEAAARAGAKLIAAGDIGQLPSVQAGGWFASLSRELAGPELREVMRQRDPGERAALEALHDGNVDEYIAFKQAQGTLLVHPRELKAFAAVLNAWDRSRQAHGLASVVMIAPDNMTRGLLNERARATLVEAGQLCARPVRVGGREFRVGDRIIARRNDRSRDVDNGTLATVRAIHRMTGALIVDTDGGGRPELDAAYVRDHVEHAYALTGHATQGASVEWAGVIGRPSDFTAEWAYTALTRARSCTELHVIAEPPASQRDRESYGPIESSPELEEAVTATRRALQRRAAEPLAIERVCQSESRSVDSPAGSRPTELPSPEPEWRSFQRLRHDREQGRRLQR